MPTRYLKQGICDSETINSLSDAAECLFYRLLVTADDFGRADGRPLVVKSRCYPIKESVTVKSIEKGLAELEQYAVIERYVVDGKPYLQILKWDNKPRAGKSKFPQPPCIYVQQNTDVKQLHTDVKQLHTESDENLGDFGESLNNQQDSVDAKHLHTNAKQCFTSVPVTVTETETSIRTSVDVASEKMKVIAIAFDAMRWLTENGVSEHHARDWLKVRKAKRAANTETAFSQAKDEAAAAGWTMAQAVEHMAANSWQGFKADWVNGKHPPGGADEVKPEMVMSNGQMVPLDFLKRVGLRS